MPRDNTLTALETDYGWGSSGSEDVLEEFLAGPQNLAVAVGAQIGEGLLAGVGRLPNNMLGRLVSDHGA